MPVVVPDLKDLDQWPAAGPLKGLQQCPDRSERRIVDCHEVVAKKEIGRRGFVVEDRI